MLKLKLVGCTIFSRNEIKMGIWEFCHRFYFPIFHPPLPTACTKECKKLCVAPEKHNYNLLAHFICTVNVTLGMGLRPWVWVRVRTHGFGYGYGYETMGMGTGPTFRLVVSMDTGTGSSPWVWVRV